MLYIFVEHITSRVEYTFDFIFRQRNIAYCLVDDPKHFSSLEGSKLNYSGRKLDVSSIFPSTLLFELALTDSKITKSEKNGVEYLSFDGVPDFIASVFYVLTRMEEYRCHNVDTHGRFPFQSSVQNQYGWIDFAVCDRWATHLIVDILHLKYEIEKGELIPTFDIDNTYAYRLKSKRRNFLSLCKDLLRRNIDRIKERRLVAKGARDPYDSFDEIRSIARRFPKTKLFWLTRSKGKNDRNVSIYNSEHRALIVSLSKEIEINIHPSYGSLGSVENIRDEIRDLETITKKKIHSSRQHFLRFQLPMSYQQLISLDIRDEFSMGFAEVPGFRSGTARSHLWFDLSTNKETELMIHPFVYMDGTLLEYQRYTIAEAKQKIEHLFGEVMEYGGDFIFLWHNETINDNGIWKGWHEVLNFTLNLGYE